MNQNIFLLYSTIHNYFFSFILMESMREKKRERERKKLITL